MPRKSDKKTRASRTLYWAPRILSILFIIFITMFSFDVFEPGLTSGQIAIALFVHNIPTIVLAILLFFSWKREWLGAITFIAAGLAYIASVAVKASASGFEWYYLSWLAIIAVPTFVVGILFWLNWIKRR